MQDNKDTKNLLIRYKPKVWDDVLLPDAIKHELGLMKDTRGFRLLLYSSPGTGKTTTARLMALGHEVKYLSGSNDFNIDVMRNIIYPFSSNHGKSTRTIIIDECENIKDAIQDAFKVTLDQAVHTNFIFITNDIHKVNDALQSRCNMKNYDFVNDELVQQKKNYARFTKRVCDEQGITYDKEAMLALINLNFPDVRHLLVNLQSLKDAGEHVTMNSLAQFAESGKQNIELYELIEKHQSAQDLYAELTKFSGKEKDALQSLGDPFFTYLNNKNLCDKTLEVAIIVSKYSNMYVDTINKFTTFLSCIIELKTLFR